MDRTANDRCLQEAARWYARLQAADCTKEEQAAFECWRAGHSTHAAAYARAEQLMGSLDCLIANDDRLQALADRAFEAPARERPARKWAVPATFAAALLIAVVALQFITQLQSSQALTVAYDTAEQRRTLVLEDGSQVEMDVGTRLEVRMSAHRREVQLLQGRALFEVAHDVERPFSVAAAGARTTALGTRFQVQSENGLVLVTLAEGSVAVDGARESGWRERLVPGEQLSFDSDRSAVEKHSVDLQHATSWSRGRHAFRGTPLAQAVVEINRYAVKKVRLGDPSLGELAVAGNFIAGDSDQIVDALAAVLPLRVVVGAGDEILLFRRYE